MDREDAYRLLWEYYNRCMDNRDGSVSEEEIDMFLDDKFGESY